MMLRSTALLVLFAVLVIAPACSNDEPPQPVSAAEAERIKAELDGRSFRQFEPGRDASPRKAVIIDFFGPVGIYAQYAEDGHVVDEWELYADDYTIERRGDDSEITVRFVEPRTRQQFPTRCEDCVPTSGFSISIRDVFNRGDIAFRVNDPEGVLPSPFPVFTSWTRFNEDEYFNGG
ncbi:MAG: hypothetical protein OXL97_03305 [Chloroflexota bacterium]|nr:hypothetical protein [Chloroflexota bacterium]MDE2884659.1 hypothetical protein [Chloroflexota bacterium]